MFISIQWTLSTNVAATDLSLRQVKRCRQSCSLTAREITLQVKCWLQLEHLEWIIRGTCLQIKTLHTWLREKTVRVFFFFLFSSSSARSSSSSPSSSLLSTTLMLSTLSPLLLSNTGDLWRPRKGCLAAGWRPLRPDNLCTKDCSTRDLGKYYCKVI